MRSPHVRESYASPDVRASYAGPDVRVSYASPDVWASYAGPDVRESYAGPDVRIIGALDSEVSSLISNLSDIAEKKISGVTFYSGVYGDKKVVIAKSGVGKVFAAMCAEAMILNYNVDKVIHIGIAGSLDKELGIKDVAIASSVVQHDMDSTALGDPPGKILETDLTYFPCAKRLVDDMSNIAKMLNIKYKVGIIASGDQFISSDVAKKKIVDTFNAIACEMEGASIGAVCNEYGVPFVVIRAMSDKADGKAHDTIENMGDIAADNSSRIVLEMLKAME